MWRLLLSGAAVMAIASGAAAQSSGSAQLSITGAPQPSITGPAQQPPIGLGIGNGAALNRPTVATTGIGITAGIPLSGNLLSSCTADMSCGSFPATPLGAVAPSLDAPLRPAAGTQLNQTGGASAGVPLSQSGSLNQSSLNQAGGLNPAARAIASAGIGIAPNQIGGAGANTAIGVQAGQSGGAPASHAPSMPGNSFAAQCANSPGCSAFQGR